MCSFSFLVWLAIFSESTSVNAQWTGRVTSEDGQPVAGAKVCSATWFCIRTDEQGVFRIDEQPYTSRSVLHFSADGFSPTTRWFPEVHRDVTLAKGSIPAWRIPKCGAKGRGQWIGDGLVVLVPSGASVRKGSDVDYWIKDIRFSPTERLRVGGGPNWSTGLPSPESLKLSVETSERELTADKEVEATSIFGVDVRGTYADGTKWRFIGNAFLTFTYERVSPEAAAFFDRILGTLCCCR